MKTKRNMAPKNDANLDANVLSIYLKEINRIPLLSREEEDRYARAAAQGDKAAQDKIGRASCRERV